MVGADGGTGRLGVKGEVCAALVARGLAVRHGRAGHHSYYLTQEGLRVRAELGTVAEGEPAESPAGFVADDGTGAGPPGGARRAAEVDTAWEGLLRIRELLLGGRDLPAPWERDRPVHAVALALEAAGCPPGGTGREGYAVAPGRDRAAPEVTWRGGADPAAAARALARCAELLDARGWQCTRHRTREGAPFLLASPRRSAR